MLASVSSKKCPPDCIILFISMLKHSLRSLLRVPSARSPLYRPVTRCNKYFLPQTTTAHRLYCTNNDHEAQPTSTDDEGSTSVSFNSHAAMIAIFTCGVCSSRNSYQFSKLSYEKGVVIVRCPSCKNLHLVSDNLGWFSKEKKNLETISKEHGIKMEVKRGTLEESLRSLGFSETDATVVNKKRRGSRINLSDKVIQAIPKSMHDEANKKE